MTQRVELIFEWLELNFLKWPKEMKFFQFRLTEMNPSSLNMTKELDSFSWVWRKELDPFSKYDRKKWIFFFEIWLKEFCCMNPRMEIFLVRVKELNFFEYDSWNWTLFFFFFFWTWLKERNPFFSDWKNWILIMTLRTQFFHMWQKFFLNITRKIEPFLLCLQKLNPFL